MEKASPVDVRKAMETASALVQAGILFVPMPVRSKAEADVLKVQAQAVIGEMLREAELLEGGDKP